MADQGWTLEPASPAAAAPQGWSLEEAKPQSSAAGAFVEHAANQGALGFGDEMVGGYKALAKKVLPESLGGAPPGTPIGDIYRHDRDEVRARLATEAQEHPIASTVGDIAGGAVPLLLAPEADGIAAAAKIGAATGAAAGLGNSDADLTKGEFAQAAKDMSKGAALGGAGGAAGQAIASKIPGVSAAVKDWLEDLSQRKAVNAIRPTAGEVKNLVQEKQLEPLGDWLLRNKVVEAGDTFGDIAAKAEGVRNAAGQALEESLGELDATGATIPKQKLVDAFTDLAADAESQGPGAKSLGDKYLAEAQKVADRPEQNLTFSQAEQWKRGFQDRVNYARQNPTALQMGDEQLAGAARKVVEDEAQNAAQQAGGDVADRFMQAKTAYGNAAKASAMAKGALARQEARNIASPSDKATALGALATGVAMGHPVAGAAAAVGVGVVNKVVRDRAASTTAVAARSLSEKIAGLAASNSRKLGAYGAVLAGALQRGGQTELDANLYVLGQTDPKFQEISRKLAEEKDDN